MKIVSVEDEYNLYALDVPSVSPFMSSFYLLLI